MNRSLLLPLLLAGALGVTSVVRADVPRLINFQGRLADAAGTPLTGSYTIWFRIYDATTGGTACHAASQAVAVNSGLFNASIGSPGGVNTACSFAVPYYLEVQIGTDAPMSPRIAMTASAFALGAASLVRPGANTSHTLGNAANQVPFSNGAVNANLNADTVDGYHYSDIVNNTLGQVVKGVYRCPNGALTDSTSCNYTTNEWCPQGGTAISCGSGCTTQTTVGACCYQPLSTCSAYFNSRICSCTGLSLFGYVR